MLDFPRLKVLERLYQHEPGVKKKRGGLLVSQLLPDSPSLDFPCVSLPHGPCGLHEPWLGLIDIILKQQK